MLKQKKYGDVFVETEHLPEGRTNPILFHLKQTRTREMKNEEYTLHFLWSSFNFGIYERSISHDNKFIYTVPSYFPIIWSVLTQEWHSCTNTKKTMFSSETTVTNPTSHPIPKISICVSIRSRRRQETRLPHFPRDENVKLVTWKQKYKFLLIIIKGMARIHEFLKGGPERSYICY